MDLADAKYKECINKQPRISEKNLDKSDETQKALTVCYKRSGLFKE